MQDYKLVYGLMDKLKLSMKNDQILNHFTSIANSLSDSNQRDDWYLAIMHWEQTQNKKIS